MSLRFAPFAVALASIVLSPAVVFGQTVTAALATIVPPPNGTGGSGGGSSTDTRAKERDGYQPNSINYRDCVKDYRYRFQVTVNNPTNLQHLQVWASLSDDCTDVTKRRAQESSCGDVLDISTPRTGPLDISMRAIVVAVKEHPKSAINTTTPACSVCDTHAESSAEPEPFTLYFMLSDSSSAVPDGETIAKWPSEVNRTTIGNLDLAGPEPPDVLTVGDGEKPPVNWNYVNATQSDHIVRYNLYCDPNSGTGTATPPATCDTAGAGNNGGAGGTQAGSGGAAGTSGRGGGANAGGNAGATGGTGGTPSNAGATGTTGGSTGNSACPSSALVEGKLPASSPCGSVLGSTNVSTNLKNLTSGTTYAVAVAAVDTVGNIGKLSKVECGTPVLVTDFFEAYRDAGGTGGGGFCSFSPGHASRFGGAAGLLTACIALLARRRRR